MRIKLKLALLTIPFLFVIACTVSEDVEESSVAWDATNYTMFNEFMECSTGEDFSEELMVQMIADWRDIGLSDSLLGSWGYAPASENNTLTNREWELSWTSKEDADLAWSEWMASEDAKAWGDKYASVLQCDSENRNGYEFVFPYNPYNFGPTSKDGTFAANFMPCTLNDGMDQTSLSNGLIAYNNWLDALDSDAVGGFYAYGVYVPVDPESEFDYWFGNFHINMDGMTTGMALWDDTGGTAKEELENAGTCANPEIFQGQVFYDPANPDFS
jgi:hypothetical protein